MEVNPDRDEKIEGQSGEAVSQSYPWVTARLDPQPVRCLDSQLSAFSAFIELLGRGRPSFVLTGHCPRGGESHSGEARGNRQRCCPDALCLVPLQSTYCATMVQHCEALNRSVQVVNLDPAAEHFGYSVMAGQSWAQPSRSCGENKGVSRHRVLAAQHRSGKIIAAGPQVPQWTAWVQMSFPDITLVDVCDSILSRSLMYEAKGSRAFLPHPSPLPLSCLVPLPWVWCTAAHTLSELPTWVFQFFQYIHSGVYGTIPNYTHLLFFF